MKILGVDYANTIARPVSGKVMLNSLESLRVIVRSGRFGNVYIISRANVLGRVLFLLRLRSLNFWERTGIPRKNIYFCWRDKDKADICKKLGVTDFVDDKLSVLKKMGDVDRRFAFNPAKKDVEKHPDVMARVIRAASWCELEHLLLVSSG